MEESKVDNIEESRASITSIKKKDNIVDAYITSIKNKDYTVYTVEESRSTSVSNRPNEITLLEKITKSSEVIIPKDNLDLYFLSGLGSSLSSVTPNQKCTPRKNKRK